MKIHVNDIQERVLESDFVDEWTTLKDRVDVEFFSTKPVTGHFRLAMFEGKVFLQLNFSLDLELPCARCAEFFTRHLDRQTDIILYPEFLKSKMLSLDLNERDVDFYRDDIIDISDYVWEEILLNIPMKPLCSDKCKGLCPSCGINLNMESCQCSINEIDPRWNNLLKIKEKLFK